MSSDEEANICKGKVFLLYEQQRSFQNYHYYYWRFQCRSKWSSYEELLQCVELKQSDEGTNFKNKNLENPSCIDLILRSSPHSFQGSCVVETGQSDFHRMVVTIIKTTLQRLPAKIRTYRNNNKLYHHKFRETLVKELSSTNT